MLPTTNYSHFLHLHLPPQLPLIVKNIDLKLDFNNFCMDVKTQYPQVKNVIRMKNKFQSYMKLVKLELASPTVRDELLLKKKIVIDYITYDIDEYLTPVNVLICSKCMGLAHFKKQCTQIKDSCRTCGDQVEDLNLHNCSQIEKCMHCGQNHRFNSLKCAVGKSFRAELTRKLLSSNNPTAPTLSNKPNNNNQDKFTFISSNFPPIPIPCVQTPASNILMIKLDDLLGKKSVVKIQLTNLASKYDRFEQFIKEKNESDMLVKEDLNLLSKQSRELNGDVG